MELTLDEGGEVAGERLVGSVSELLIEEEYIDDQDRIVSQVRDETGKAYELVSDDGRNLIEARSA
jgi:hypothetical protein